MDLDIDIHVDISILYGKLIKIDDRPVKGVEVFAVVSEHGDEDHVAEETHDGRNEKHEALQPPLQPLKQLHPN